MLDIKESRRLTLEDVETYVSMARERVNTLMEASTNLQKQYTPPEMKSLKSIEGLQLENMIVETAVVFGLWKRVATGSSHYKTSLTKIEELLKIVLHNRVYTGATDAELKKQLLEDRQFANLQMIHIDLRDVIAISEGEASAWFALHEALKKVATGRERDGRIRH